jgi:hypothetical protein
VGVGAVSHRHLAAIGGVVEWREPDVALELLSGRFHPQFRDKNRCGIGKSQSEWGRIKAGKNALLTTQGGSWLTPPSAILICVGFMVDGVAKE